MFKILVVEDDRDLNRTVCSFLNQSGYEAVGCLNATDAYDAMYETMFDLIVSDIMMPGIDGFEFAKNVRALNENIHVGDSFRYQNLFVIVVQMNQECISKLTVLVEPEAEESED